MRRRARRLVVAPFRRLLRTAAGTHPGRRLLTRIQEEISSTRDTPSGSSEPGGAARSALARERWNTSKPGPTYALPGDPPRERLNGLCWIEDWDDPVMLAAMRRILSGEDGAFQRGMAHRKHWEFAHVLAGLEKLAALRPDAWVLAVGAGHEHPVFELTTRVRWVFATDLYGTGSFGSSEADVRMMSDPDSYAFGPYNRNRLVVQQMNALDLRFERATFDAVYSLSSIEHFGGAAGATMALGEMARVSRPGGIVALTTECIVNGAPTYSAPGQELFTPDDLRALCSSQPDLVPVQKLDFSLSERTRSLTPIPLTKAVEDGRRGHTDFPHILLETEGRVFTSFAVLLRKAESAA